MLGDDLEVIPTPGHTAGVTMFLWDNGAHRFLFTGDSIWMHTTGWEAVVLEESNRAAYLDSLSIIQDLDFDVLVPWVSMHGQPCVDVIDRRRAHEQISGIAARVRAGANQ